MDKPKIWLLFEQREYISTEYGHEPVTFVQMNLLAVDTEKWISDKHKRMMEHDARFFNHKDRKYHVEENQANHLFGYEMLQQIPHRIVEARKEVV